MSELSRNYPLLQVLGIKNPTKPKNTAKIFERHHYMPECDFVADLAKGTKVLVPKCTPYMDKNAVPSSLSTQRKI